MDQNIIKPCIWTKYDGIYIPSINNKYICTGEKDEDEELVKSMVEIPFKESEVVDGLCKSSPEFNDFYENERLKYDDEIEWFQKPDLEEGLNAYANVEKFLDGKIKFCKIYCSPPEEPAEGGGESPK